MTDIRKFTENFQQEKKELHDYVRLLKADARAARQATTESDIVVRELKDRVMDLESLLSKAKLESQSTVEQVNRHYAELKQKYRHPAANQIG